MYWELMVAVRLQPAARAATLLPEMEPLVLSEGLAEMPAKAVQLL
jgi:hypothetical protein